MLIFVSVVSNAEQYQRNKAVPVEKVLFGKVLSVRNITEKELIKDKKNGWKVFGGAVLGGVIGHQIGQGSGQDIATILGVLIGASMSNENMPKQREKVYRLVELMIKVEDGQEYMVVQERDPTMLFAQQDEIRMVFLANNTVRIDKRI
ncbi:MAG: glycine zipper 2TM domain-containing protein [Thalassotalea sp.]|nr:glycine zipper 2TM domain-containing protein [Thalassotalea sp.]